MRAEYGERDETRREHSAELRAFLGLRPYVAEHATAAVEVFAEVAVHTVKGTVLAATAVEFLRSRNVVLPSAGIVDLLCSEALTIADRQVYTVLADSLTAAHRVALDALLDVRDGSRSAWLSWLREAPLKANSRSMNDHIERLRKLRSLGLSVGVDRLVHRNRLLKLAREGGQMAVSDLAKFESRRRYATLVALVFKATATVTDEIIDTHDRIVG